MDGSRRQALSWPALLAAGLAACGGTESAPSGGALSERLDDVRASRGALAAPAWEEATSLPEARRLHTATLLRDDTVLVAGGTGPILFEDAMRFDPQTLTWSPAGHMHVERERGAAALLSDGRVLVVGGTFEPPQGGAPDRRASVYGLDGAWASTEPAPWAPSAAPATLLQGGRVLVAGGHESDWTPTFLTTAVYDPGTNAWLPAGSMKGSRHNHTATLLPDGRALVAGGDVGIEVSSIATAEIYDPAEPDPARAWRETSPMAEARTQHTATLLPDGRVLVAGGSRHHEQGLDDALSSAEIYDPASETWSKAQPMHVRRAGHTATLLQNGAVLLVGGLDDTLSALESAEMFDPFEGTWVLVEPMHHGRFEHTATLLADGRVLVVGGRSSATVEVFRLGDDGAPCSIDRQCAGGICADGVCCETRCDAMCQFCALPGAEGSCLPVPDGEDPRRDCGDGEPCADACGPDQTCTGKEGRVCSPARCHEDGLAVLSSAECGSESASCPAPFVESCAPYRCDAAAGACTRTCRSVEDCAPGYGCDLSGACVPPPVPARDPAECASHLPREEGPASSAAILLFLGAAGLLRRTHRRFQGRA